MPNPSLPAAPGQLDFAADLSYEHGLRDPNWLYMRRFLAELQSDFEKKSRFVLYIATRWLVACDMLRTYEESVLFEGKATEFEREYFRGCLAIVKGHGVLLLALLKRNEEYAIKERLGFSEEDLAAIVDELECNEGVVLLIGNWIFRGIGSGRGY